METISHFVGDYEGKNNIVVHLNQLFMKLII